MLGLLPAICPKTILSLPWIALASLPIILPTKPLERPPISGKIHGADADALSSHLLFPRYFDFHPAPDDSSKNISQKTHGLVPVWGFGTVVESTHARISVGERVYGYLAPTRYLIVPVSPSDVNKHAFYVPRPHLPTGLPLTLMIVIQSLISFHLDRRPYNQILRCSTDPLYDPSPDAEDLTMLYRPLFWTSFWCEDWLNSSNYRNGARRVLISSASAKTAFCLAYLVGKRKVSGMRIVGLTSKKNIEFTKGLGLYDDVVDYDTFGSSQAMKLGGEKWIYLDVAGNEDLNKKIYGHFDSSGTLSGNISFGMTNLSPTSGPSESAQWSKNSFERLARPSTAPESFFMVEWLDIRKHQLSISEIFGMQDKAWKELMADCRGWVKIERVNGPKQVEKAYQSVSKGGLGPEKGFIWSLWDENLSAKL